MKKLTALLLTLALTAALTGCAANSLTDIRVAYVNSFSASGEETAIAFETRHVAKVGEMRLYRLALQLAANKPESESLYSVFPEGLRINSVALKDGIISVDYGAKYGELSPIERSLADYCTTLTLCAFEDITGVVITVDGQGSGEPLTPENTVTSRSQLRLRSYEISLYYPYSHSGTLIGIDTELKVSDASEPAEEAMRMLMTGRSAGATVLAFLSKSVRLLSVNVQNRICYVDMSENMTRSCEYNEAGINLSAYSIINTLCQFSYIDRVQILINGEPAGLTLGLGSDDPLPADSSLIS